ncbi:MAG: hypothetical protein QOH39_253 [Verrucomicrobiota bacterium]|jgi:hypothetical protein
MKTFRSPFLSVPFAVLLTLVLARFVVAADRKGAHVTQVVHDVRLLTSQTASRAATINESIGEGTAVRTGTDSRAELTFADESLTRLGANTVFSFGPGHNFDLTSGAMLLAVPKEAGTAHITTAAVTAAISGGVAMIESHKNSWRKFIVLEGQGVITIKGTNQSITLFPGQIVALPPGATKFTKVQNIDLEKLTKKSLLLRFSKMPHWAKLLVDKQVEKQHISPPAGGVTDPSGFDAIDQRAASQTPPPIHTPRPPG